MEPVRCTMANTQWHRWTDCALTWSKYGESDEIAEVGLGRCTVVLVPGREC